MAGQDLQADAVFGEVLGGIDQMLEIMPQPVELPDDKGIAFFPPSLFA